MARAALSLGSNLEPERHIAAAFAALAKRFPGAVFSQVYRFAAVGFEGPDFLNAAAVIETDLGPPALDAWLHALEDAHGRDRSGPRFGSRTLDIDLVLYDGLVMQGPGHLQLPRAELEQAFVLMPLAQIAAEWVIPGDGRSLGQAWRAHPQHGTVCAAVRLSDFSA